VTTDSSGSEMIQERHFRRAFSWPESLRAHWPEYVMEAALLGGFMLSACLFGMLYQHPASPVRAAIHSAFLCRVLMGLSMGATAVVLIHSPWGKQSGAHMNPSVTLAFLRLGRIATKDAVLYISAQFAGGVFVVWLLRLALRPLLAHPDVRYVVTVPGMWGAAAALVAEISISALLMIIVLNAASRPSSARYTGWLAGLMVTIYIVFEAPVSGMSMNPARTFASALPSGTWSGFWIYLIGPPLGMLLAAEIFLRWRGGIHAPCAKLHHNNNRRCIHCGMNGGGHP
jgi:aquaporin Z